MPEERIYQSRVSVGGPQRAVLSDARDFGAGIGAAIEQAGSAVHQLQIRDYRLDRQEKADSEAADFSKRFSQLRTDTDAAIREARANHGPGAQGHAKAMLERVEKQREFGRLKFEYSLLRARWGGYSGYDRWFARTLNNAHLAAVATYHDCVPGLRRELEAAGSLPAFYARAAELAEWPLERRRAAVCGGALPRRED